VPSIDPRPTADGRVHYRVRWRVGGKPHSLTFPDERSAKLAAKRIDALGYAPDDLTVGTVKSPHTVAEAIDRHMAQLVGIQPDTRAEYERYARTHLAPLADMLVGDVDRDVLARWVGGLDLAPKTIKNLHGFLSAVMATAVRDGLIDRNPCAGMRLPRTDGHEQRFLSGAEYLAIRAHLAEPYGTLADFLAGTGCRFGEATALTIRDVDSSARTARIAKAWKRTPQGWVVGPPKTHKSRRTVWLPPELVAALEPLRAGPGDALLFVSRSGGRVSQQTFGANWHRAAKAAMTAPPMPRVHDLRHSHAAWLIAQGVPLPTIQDRLGHESITTAIDRYGPLEADLRVAAADAAGAIWRQAPALGR
jgi:integrase